MKSGLFNINSTDTCFHSDGQSYRGNVSVTQSGYTCQSWTSQCPHRHHRTPDNFPELRNAGNACRNPGGQAPHGPWCYTTNPKQRWEYCRVEMCEARKESEGLFMENVVGLRCIRRALNKFVRMWMRFTRGIARDDSKQNFLPLKKGLHGTP